MPIERGTVVTLSYEVRNPDGEPLEEAQRTRAFWEADLQRRLGGGRVAPDGVEEFLARDGLVGMRERLALLGGSLSVESKPGGGTQ